MLPSHAYHSEGPALLKHLLHTPLCQTPTFQGMFSFKNTVLQVLPTPMLTLPSLLTNSVHSFLFLFLLLQLRETSNCNNISVRNMTESFSLLSIILRHFIIFSQHMCLASSVTSSFLFSHPNPHFPGSKLHKTTLGCPNTQCFQCLPEPLYMF